MDQDQSVYEPSLRKQLDLPRETGVAEEPRDEVNPMTVANAFIRLFPNQEQEQEQSPILNHQLIEKLRLFVEPPKDGVKFVLVKPNGPRRDGRIGRPRKDYRGTGGRMRIDPVVRQENPALDNSSFSTFRLDNRPVLGPGSRGGRVRTRGGQTRIVRKTTKRVEPLAGDSKFKLVQEEPVGRQNVPWHKVPTPAKYTMWEDAYAEVVDRQAATAKAEQEKESLGPTAAVQWPRLRTPAKKEVEVAAAVRHAMMMMTEDGERDAGEEGDGEGSEAGKGLEEAGEEAKEKENRESVEKEKPAEEAAGVSSPSITANDQSSTLPTPAATR